MQGLSLLTAGGVSSLVAACVLLTVVTPLVPEHTQAQ